MCGINIIMEKECYGCKSLLFCNSSSVNLSRINCLNSTLLPIKSGTAGNNPFEFTPVHGAAKQFCYVFYGLVLFFGVFGNIIVFYVLGYRKKKRNSGDVYILSLACADFLASLIVPMVFLNDLVSDYSNWFYGKAMCYVLPTISPLTMCASGWSLVLISVDRYRIISSPLAQKPRRLVLYCTVAFVWLSSISVILPFHLQLELVNGVCWHSNNELIGDEDVFISVTVWVVYSTVIPNFVIIVSYCLTARALRANTMVHDNNRAMQQRNKQNAKTVRMFVIIVIVYFVLTMPYAIFYFYACYLDLYDASNPSNSLVNTLNYILFIPASANGCVNPVIYAKMHKEVNGYIKTVLQRIMHTTWLRFRLTNRETSAPSLAWSGSSSKTNKSTE